MINWGGAEVSGSNNSVPAKTFDEFVAWAKVNRGKLTYANYGPGTLSHFLGYQVSER